MIITVRESALASVKISDESGAQMERLELLQGSVDLLSEAITDSVSKVGVTATISADLNRMAQDINQLMAAFTFDSSFHVSPRDHEKRRNPRAKIGLLTYVWCDGKKLEEKGVTSDFSLSGVQLRMPAGMDLAVSSLKLEIMTPCDSSDEYRNQSPLRIAARIIRRRNEGENTQYALEFLEVTGAQQKRIEECFAYFQRNAHYDAE